MSNVRDRRTRFHALSNLAVDRVSEAAGLVAREPSEENRRQLETARLNVNMLIEHRCKGKV